MIVAALTGGAAVAAADPGMQPDIPTIDEWQIQFPATLTNPVDDDENGLSPNGGGIGMVCENLTAHCG